MQSTRTSLPLRRLGALSVLLTALAAAPANAGPSTGELQSQLGTAQQREHALDDSIGRENARISGYQGTIDDLTTRLRAIEETLDREQTQLEDTQHDLRDARVKLARLQAELRRDRRALAAQLVAQYELPEQDLVSVVVDSAGFSGLVERIDDLKRLRDQNVRVTTRVGQAQEAVTAQTKRLTELERHRKLIVDSALVQRDEAARLRLAVVDRQAVILRARSHDRGQLATLNDREASLRHTLRTIQAREARAAAAAAAANAPSAPTGGAPAPTAAPFSAHGGSTGFFQSPGTNYSVGVEPTLAARLDQLGKALGLHLIGISGYRTPEHSVEVGGFPNDPHTRGEASDTPGVEGVPEGTLNQYGLTRPFGGAAEADHIQLLGG